MTEVGSVLVVGHAEDEHADAVQLTLTARGFVRIIRCSREDLPAQSFVWTPTGDRRLADFVLKAGWSGLWRRPSSPRVSDYLPAYREFVSDESVDAFDGMLESAGIRWLTSPWMMRRAELKLVQLQTAAFLGLPTPRTVVTNDAATAINFARECKEVVVKPVRYGLLRTDDRPRLAYTTEVGEAELASLEGPPVILQERLNADVHLRIVTVGDSVFTGQVRADEVDWRATLENHGRFEPAPRDIHESAASLALSLTQALGLGFSAQDWIVTLDRGPVFLEANPNGQWLFLDPLWDGAITTAIAERLERLACTCDG